MTNLNPDKWNPSDIFLIKNSSDVVKHLDSIDNINDYNTYFSEFKDIIGISLKKSDKEALHGAIALESVMSLKDSNHKKLKIVDNMVEIKTNLKTQLKELRESQLSDLIFISKFQSKNINDNIDSLTPSSANFKKSLPLGIAFLTQNCNDVKSFLDLIKLAYLTASSKHPLSCVHFKADDEHISKIVNEEDFNFKFEKIIIPLNGDTNIIFAININNEPIKLQLRSKGSRPQFIIVKTDATKGEFKNIKEFE